MRRSGSFAWIVVLLLAACGGKREEGDRKELSAPPDGALAATEDTGRAPDAAVAMEEVAPAVDTAVADVPAAVEAEAEALESEDAGLARAADGALLVPPQNQAEGTRPGVESAAELSRLLLAAIVADDPASAARTVFPAEAFEILKDLPEPLAYHRRMVRWYEEDLHAEHQRLGEPVELSFERFQLGRCTWQAPHTEGNLIAYWSCRRNRIFARAGTRPVEVEIRVVINWGDRWYIAHLGPVRR
jgi:hypothetical protein